MSERESIRTTCPHDCYDACGVVVIKHQGEIVKVKGDRLLLAQAANSAQVPINILKALERLGTLSNESLESDVVMRPSLPAR